jgi:plasmid maintenance system antidote protein VapI
MSRDKAQLAITDVLRQAIVESGTSHKALSRETGVTRASIMRFARGDQSLRLDMADRLAEYLGLILTKRK